MAEISTYAQDSDVTGTDRVIGTDAVNNITRNYTLDSIAGFVRNEVNNQNGADADEPSTFKLWSGTEAEYDALTPSSDTLYNVTNDIGIVQFSSIGGTPTTLAGYGITDGGLPSFVTSEDSFVIDSYTFSSAETFGATTMSLTTTVGLQIGDQFVNNNTTHTITEVQTNFVRVTPGVSSPFGIPSGAVFDWTRPGNFLLLTDSFLRLTGSGDTLTLNPNTVLFDSSYDSLSNVPNTFPPSSHTHPFSDITDRPTTPTGYGITSGFSDLDYVTEEDENIDVGTYTANAIIGGTGLRLTDSTGIQIGDFHVFSGTRFTVTGFPGITNVITVSPTPSFSEVGVDLLFQRFSTGVVTITGNLTITGSSSGISYNNLDNTPTTISGYGITDAVVNFSDLGTTPTTILGYGISDAVVNFDDLGTTPTTLTGYGITDSFSLDSIVSQPTTTGTLDVLAGQLLFGSREDIADNLYRVLANASITDRSGLGGVNFELIRESKANNIANVNATATNEPAAFKIWSGTLVEYTALTKSSDTLYNVTDE